MKHSKLFIASLAMVAALPCILVGTMAKAQRDVLPRPEGPCDVYAAAGDACAAAHSTTRALLASYNGPLYQVMRQSDNKTLDIGVVQPTATDAGGYADAAAQDAFCKDTYCWITVIYDQSGNENHLRQAPRGGFGGPAMGGFNNISLADWAPVTLNGHKVYGVFIAPGMGYRWNDTKGTAVDDQAEGQYWVINGHHFNSGCCFDYGNAETDSRDDGDGTMETTYYGNQPVWFHGEAPGPWIMTDQENNLIGCVNPDPNDKFCEGLESISWRFVTATADGEPHHWRSMGGDAQQGDLKTYYDGIRLQNPRSSYDPMRKQGAILLGNGGDNSNGSSGTFYEGAMTKAGTFPTIETNQAVQANVVAAKYDVARLQVSAADKTYAPNNLQTFALSSSANTAVTFYNNTGEPIDDLTISLNLPKKWKANVLGSKDKVRKVGYTVEPGQTVVVTFSVKSSNKAFNGDLMAKASWSTADGKSLSETAVEKVRNVSPVKINEFRIASGDNKTNSFIELYNAGDKAVNLSDWTITHHIINVPAFSQIRIPKGVKLESNAFYLLGLANSGLSAPAVKGDKVIYVRDVTGISAGDVIEVGTGAGKETVKVAGIIQPATQPVSSDPWAMRNRFVPGTPTTLWQPLPEGPVITIPAGSNNIPVTSTAGMEVGGKLAIGYGATYPTVSNTIEKYEVVTITEVGKPGTQAYLAMDAKPGDTNIKLSSTANISVGDKIRLDIDSEGHGIEWVTVKAVGTQSVRNTLNGPLRPDEDPGTGVDLEEPLKFFHSSNMPYGVNGSGVTFEPATKFDHSSNEPVLALVYAIELESPLAKNHDVDDVVFDAKVVDAGYHGCAEADQLYGGPAFGSQGNITLRDAKDNIVDALNYGGVVDPWLGEGFQGQSGLEEPGNFVQTPAAAAQRGAVQTSAPNISAGRYPDGFDNDENESDFKVHSAVTLAAPVKPGDRNIKLSSTSHLRIGQRLFIGADNEEVIAAVIGTPGYAPLALKAATGTKQLEVSGVQGFAAGQTVLVGDEQAVIAEVRAARRNYWAPVQTPQNDIVILQDPLKKAHGTDEALAGTGVSVSSPVKGSYAAGSQVTDNIPTPGAPNRF